LFSLSSLGDIRLSGWATNWLQTTAVFRDPSAWYHILLAVDTTQATASNRLKLYVNGSQITAFALANYPSQNLDLPINATGEHDIGVSADFYLADVHLIDGQALTPSSFTEVSATTGQLIPKEYTGTFGTNGFWLQFSDNSNNTATTLGKDYSGNNNNWSPSNLSVTAGTGNDSLVDTPTSVSATDTGIGGEIRGNYATFNPIGTVKPATGIIPTLTNGNLDATHSGGSWQYANSTIAVPAGSGKYYCEFYVSSSYASDYIAVGVNPATASTFSATVHSSSQSGIFYSNNGEKWVTGSNSAYGAAYTTGDLIGVALNCDSGQITFYKNNTSQGAISFNSNLTNGGTIYFTIDIHTSNLVANFGQRPFAYTAPSGFKALCDTNLPAPVVAKSSDYFQTVLYTGNGSTQTISGLGFSPDLVWIKQRSGAQYHTLQDTVRGATNDLYSNATDAESTYAQSLNAFNSDGFTVGSLNWVNQNSQTYAAWTWDAGTTTSSNGSGSITSQVRASASSGFSIVSYTAAYTGSARTVGHGLGVKPNLIILKNRNDGSANWRVYHSASGASLPLVLNSTAAASANIGIWNNTEPTSSIFTIGVNTDVGGNIGSGEGLIAYCFAPVDGYSSAFSYTGNGASGYPNADGPYIHLGFRPRLILIKCSSAVENWVLYDTARSDYNYADDQLYPNLGNAEATGANREIDILSNGFKVRSNGGIVNTNAATYIGFAWAESPFQYARAR